MVFPPGVMSSEACFFVAATSHGNPHAMAPGTRLAGRGFRLTNAGLRAAKGATMNEFSAFGGLIPLWILGAGLALGVLEWMTTPRRRDRT